MWFVVKADGGHEHDEAPGLARRTRPLPPACADDDRLSGRFHQRLVRRPQAGRDAAVMYGRQWSRLLPPNAALTGAATGGRENDGRFTASG